MNVLAFYRILYLAWVFSEIAILVVTRTRQGGGDIQDRGSLRILWLVILVSVSLGSYYGDTHPHTIDPITPWAQAAAIIPLILGLAIRWTAIVTLGRSFSANVAIRATQTVHKTGVFRFVPPSVLLGTNPHLRRHRSAHPQLDRLRDCPHSHRRRSLLSNPR
jgi:protein-S-isoprenylcysteine O-methyltransferase Ste14